VTAVYEVLSYIHENICETLDISTVSSHFGYSKWHFCKKFREYTSTTFGEYVRHYRVSLAAIDILDGKKITDVAMDYGYDTLGGFNKAFLKEYGCLPREYRKYAKDCQLHYERRKNSMYKLSERLAFLREETLNKTYAKKHCFFRKIYFAVAASEAYKSGASEHEVIAAGLSSVLENFKPFIAPHELICGFNYGDVKGDMYKSEEEQLPDMRANGIPEADIAKFYSIEHSPVVDKMISGQGFNMEAEVDTTPAEKAARLERSALGRNTNANHSVIGYERVLKMGFEGIYDHILECEKKNGTSPFYEASKRVCRSAMAMGEKYAAEARRLIKEAAEGYSEDDLRRIAEVCERVPRYPASSFIEAVQSLWFAHIINTWEDLINANSLGRLDQILYPYYKADIEKGVISKEEAYELIGCLWLKLYLDYDVQQSCVGGVDNDGNDATNELSYMMLDITEQLDFIRCMSVRFGEKTDKAFIKRALEVVGHVGKGVPFFFNDDVMIPALIYGGVSEGDARDYTQIGCVETVIPGKSNPHAVTGEVNFLKALELVFSNGAGMIAPKARFGLRTGELDTFDTYEKLYSAVLCQIDNLLELSASQVKKFTNGIKSPKPFKSMLTDGCLESGKDFNEKGAKYDYYQIMLAGVPNLADSLAVIKKFVYTDKKYTLAELYGILENNFPDEMVRLEFVNKAPKFGNDVEEVDRVAADIINHACDKLLQLSDKYSLNFHAQPFTFLWMIDYGKNTAATPDGRRAGELVAYSVSPMQGRDREGLTSLFKSISTLPTKRTPGTTSAIVEVDPKLFTDHNIDALADMLIAAGKLGLANVQFNTVDADTLIDAKAHPDKYNNLAVRVSGFSQKFNLLNSELQDHIIGRTKHSCF